MHRTFMALALALALGLLLAPPAAFAEEIRLVGFVTQQGQKRCLKEWREEWLDLHHQVGFTRLTGTPSAKAFEGKIVVVTGVEDKPFKWPSVPAHEVECPVPQMRSDWVEGKGGIRVRRADSPFANFKHSSIEELKGLTVTLQDQPVGPPKLNIRYHNHLMPLGNVTLTVHYEGCYGKPGSTSDTHKVGSLGTGDSFSHALAAIVSRDKNPRGKTYRAASIQLRAEAPGLHLDFDVPLSAWQAGVSCPSRQSK